MKSGSLLPGWLTGSVFLSWHLCSLLAPSGSSWWGISTSLPPRLSPGTPRYICPRLTSWGEPGNIPRFTFQVKRCDLTVPERGLFTENQAQSWPRRYSWVYFRLLTGPCGPSQGRNADFRWFPTQVFDDGKWRYQLWFWGWACFFFFKKMLLLTFDVWNKRCLWPRDATVSSVVSWASFRTYTCCCTCTPTGLFVTTIFFLLPIWMNTTPRHVKHSISAPPPTITPDTLNTAFLPHPHSHHHPLL